MKPSETFRQCLHLPQHACLTSIFALAGTQQPCEVCAEAVQKMREILEWKEVWPGFYFSAKHLTAEQKSRVQAAIEEAVDAQFAGSSYTLGLDLACESSRTMIASGSSGAVRGKTGLVILDDFDFTPKTSAH